MKPKFQDLSSFTAEDVLAAIERNDPAELALVSVTVALLSSEPGPAVNACVKLASHENPAVRGNALVSLGHIARRFLSLDERTVGPLIEAGLRDPDAGVRILAKSAADEIHQFLHWTIAGHNYG